VKSLALLCLVVLSSCSTKEKPALQQVAPVAAGVASTTSKHPLAKYVELAGFRLTEATAGKLNVKFAAINHSDADLGDLTVKIRLKTNQSAPQDPPVTEFEAKIPSLGPEETKDISAQATTKLRIYELPDWQFLRAEFDITSPQP